MESLVENSMEGPRPLHEHELQDFVQFLSRQLRADQAWSIAEEYPLAIHDANLNNVHVIKSNEGFLSAAVMKPLIVKSPAGLFKVAAIGSVVTAPEHRKLGLSRQILEASLQTARAHGCDFAILWTNLFDFYRKLGFELAGTEVSLELPMDLKAEDSGLRFMKGPQVDPEAILRLYSQHTTGSVRTVDEIRKYLQIPNSRIFTAWDAQNKLQAFAVEGKGADLEGYIHEWGGGVSKLIPLLQYAISQENRALTLISPAHSANLIRQLTSLGAIQGHGILGMIKILNASNLLLKLKKLMRGMGLEDVVLEMRDQKFYFGYKENIFSTDSEGDLVRLIFGPQKASQIHKFDAPTAETLEKVFPLPMWLWGWDSV